MAARFSCDSASRSSLREETPSFENTFLRCHSTVRGPLWNRLGPDLRVGETVAREAAICSSCGVDIPRLRTVRLRTRSPVASNSRRARSANAAHANRGEHLVRSSQVLAGVDDACPRGAATRRREDGRGRDRSGIASAQGGRWRLVNRRWAGSYPSRSAMRATARGCRAPGSVSLSIV